MSLTASQKTALKTDISTNTNTVLINGVPMAIDAVPVSPDNCQAIANWYNQPAGSGFLIFNSAIPNQQVWNQVLFAAFTPNDAVTSANAQEWTAWSMSCQGKQFNLANMLQPGASFNAGLLDYRKGLKDALTSLPSGTGGATQDGGWNATLNITPNVLVKTASNIEVLFAVATTGPLAGGTNALGTGGTSGTTSNVALAVYDSQINGALSGSDVLAAMTGT